jgi:hypothetical protein
MFQAENCSTTFPIPSSLPLPGSNASRRSLLSAIGAAVLAPAGVGAVAACERRSHAPGMDAELIRLCEAFDLLERQRLELFDGPSAINDDEDRTVADLPLEAKQAELLDVIFEIPATTMAGVIARAKSIFLYDAELLNPNYLHDPKDRMVAALVRDMAELSSGRNA